MLIRSGGDINAIDEVCSSIYRLLIQHNTRLLIHVQIAID